ncbi:hypothetical protein [Burkholderia metallica]|uniref:hypothetical protein n=1 Tax=Burkholderia metallica TaxID=488729 RepID=UPI001C2D4855|nr:hypothetical protein [Burkholderia metallica]
MAADIARSPCHEHLHATVPVLRSAERVERSTQAFVDIDIEHRLSAELQRGDRASFMAFFFVEHLEEPQVDLLDGVAHAFHPAARMSLRQAPVRMCRCRRSAATGAPVSLTTPLMLERRKHRSIGGDLHRLFPDTLIDEGPPPVLRVPWRAAR